MIRSPRYGEINTKNISPEVYKIWLTRNDELPELPKVGFSHDFESDVDWYEKRDLVTKIFSRPLSEIGEHVVLRLVIDGATLDEVGDEFGLSRERIRQIRKKALRLLFSWGHHKYDCAEMRVRDAEVMTWVQWKSIKEKSKS